MAPLQNHTRCLRHAGPHAARRHRDEQLRELAAGRLDPAVFEKAERRRAANRLRYLWKKDPWAPGATLDLGVHEDAFRTSLAAFGWRTGEMPPAVLDWARWRFRRLQVDRRQDAGWAKALDRLADRLAKAGPSPRELRSDPAMSAAFITPDRVSGYSRRTMLDQQREPCEGRKPLKGCHPVAGEATGLFEFLVRHRRDLEPVLARCSTNEHRLLVADCYRRLLDEAPGNSARAEWLSLLRKLQT